MSQFNVSSSSSWLSNRPRLHRKTFQAHFHSNFHRQLFLLATLSSKSQPKNEQELNQWTKSDKSLKGLPKKNKNTRTSFYIPEEHTTHTDTTKLPKRYGVKFVLTQNFFTHTHIHAHFYFSVTLKRPNCSRRWKFQSPADDDDDTNGYVWTLNPHKCIYQHTYIHIYTHHTCPLPSVESLLQLTKSQLSHPKLPITPSTILPSDSPRWKRHKHRRTQMSLTSNQHPVARSVSVTRRTMQQNWTVFTVPRPGSIVAVFLPLFVSAKKLDEAATFTIYIDGLSPGVNLAQSAQPTQPNIKSTVYPLPPLQWTFWPDAFTRDKETHFISATKSISKRF